MKNSFLIVAFLFLQIALFGQARGLVWDDNTYGTVPLSPIYKGYKFDDIATRKDLSIYSPTPGNQYQISSCVGWASGYGALSILIALNNKTTDKAQIDKMAMSALFVYNNIKLGDCTRGSYLHQAGDFLKTSGDIPSEDFDKSNDCLKKPTSEQLSQASQYRIKEYIRLFEPDMSMEEKVFKTKQSLAADKPVVIGMNVTAGFQRSLGVEVWDATFQPEVLGGHAMVVVGYDEYRQAFKLMNSWGTSWGNGGFIWVKYQDYADYCKYGFQFIIGDTKPVTPTTTTTLSGTFDFRIPEFGANDSMYFANVQVTKSGDMYRTVKNDWKIGQFFQVVASNMKKDSYVYVFSIDPVNKGEIHHPFGDGTISAFGMETVVIPKKKSDIIPDKDIVLVIPQPKINDQGVLEEQAMYKSQKGTDYLVILYSDRHIDNTDLKNRIQNVLRTDVSKPFTERFNAGFSDIAAPSSNINYDNNRMNFTATVSGATGYVVPLILAVEAQ